MTRTGARMTAEDRRAQMIDAAMTEFAVGGLHGTSTEDIARRAGISQPYLFRLFGTKKELFMACYERGCARVLETFEAAAERDECGNVLDSMGAAYVELLADRESLLVQMHAYAACADAEIRASVRERYSQLYRFVERASGAGEAEVRSFFAHGMLLNVAAAMDLPAVAPRERWAHKLLGLPPG